MAARWRTRSPGGVSCDPFTSMSARGAGVRIGMLLCLPLAILPAFAATCREPAPDAPLPDVTLQPVASGFDQPVHVTHAGDGSGRLFVVEQAGVIRIVAQGRMLSAPFLDIRDRVASGGEKGLLSVAFHPRFRDNGLFYVNYTAQLAPDNASRGRRALHTVIARYRIASTNLADRASESVLLTIEQPYGNHNGGQIAFGPDGYLYVGMGDGGAANDPHNHGQNLATLLGAMLRIDVDREQLPRRYAIPADNPFIETKGARAEIWAYGFRNPWRFAFDRVTGRLFVADVGQNAVEEIDIVRRGGNYGWRIMEGDICTPGVSASCDNEGLEKPLFTYRHPEGFSVTGGGVYRGNGAGALCGAYLFADYVTKHVWALRLDGDAVAAQREIASIDENISSFGEDEHGELYVVGHQSGRLLKVVAAPSGGASE